MNDMRKLLNIVESAMVKEQNPKGPPQRGTPEYEQMHQALDQLGRLRQFVAREVHRRWPNYDADRMLDALLYVQEQLQRPMQILDRMETDESGREFRVQNMPWSILVHGDRNSFQKLINSEQGPENISKMFVAMDRDLTNLYNKLDPSGGARRFIGDDGSYQLGQ